ELFPCGASAAGATAPDVVASFAAVAAPTPPSAGAVEVADVPVPSSWETLSSSGADGAFAAADFLAGVRGFTTSRGVFLGALAMCAYSVSGLAEGLQKPFRKTRRLERWDG